MRLITLVKIVPGKTNEGLERLRALAAQDMPDGVKTCLSWITYGSYDLVWAWEAPDMKTANQVLQEATKEGLFTTETMAAQDSSEF
ncbi:MAG: GYD domain-containing protein [Armatimonadia bacterium]|jgi:uncharacterized protein with GYD domain|nr:GYD domain-containing protein [Armatimonadia bacterium]